MTLKKMKSNYLKDNLPSQYSTIYSTVFSPNGDYLVAGNDSGKIALWKLDSILTRDGSKESKKSSTKKCPQLIFKACNNSSIFTMTTTDRFLMVGSVGEIKAFSWAEIYKLCKSNVSSVNLEPAWSITLYPSPNSSISSTEINWMELYKDRDSTSDYKLVAGGGDSNVHVYDLETREELNVLKGHENYIHSVSVSKATGQIASGSEDGSVRIWDIRKKRPQVAKIVPSDRPELHRPKFGKWIGAVGLNSDWLLCGGGPAAALWHLKSMAPSSESFLPPTDSSVTVVSLLSDLMIIGGGSGHKMYQTDYNGHVLAEVQTASSCIYSISHQETPVKVLAISGSSSEIDLCTPNFSYKDQTINFPIST